MRKLLLLLVLALGCDSPGSNSGASDPVSCVDGYEALCAALCDGYGFTAPDDGHQWSTQTECRHYLVLGGYQGDINEGWGCLYDDGTSYAPCIAAVHRINCDDPQTVVDAFSACSRPLTP